MGIKCDAAAALEQKQDGDGYQEEPRDCHYCRCVVVGEGLTKLMLERWNESNSPVESESFRLLLQLRTTPCCAVNECHPTS